AFTDPEVIRAWWAKYPMANIGIPTGEMSGFVVVDVDDKAGLPALKNLAHCSPRDIPRQRTGRDDGGWPFLFRHPGSHVKNGTKFLPGLDSRGDGGYIIAAPSLHVSGRHYKWLYLPDIEKFPVLPAPLLDAINNSNSNGKKNRFNTDTALKGFPAGTRT